MCSHLPSRDKSAKITKHELSCKPNTASLLIVEVPPIMHK